MAHIIAFANHKGGVGKTTSTVNTAYALTLLGKTVLVLDADPQGNASTTLGSVSLFEQPKTSADLFTDKGSNFSNCAVPSRYEKLDLIPSNINVAGVASMLSLSDPKRFLCFKNKFDAEADKRYDYILVDCPPTIDGPFLVNSLVLAHSFIIPIEAESVYALAGVDALLKAVETLTEGINANISLLGALVTMYDSRTTAGKFMSEAIEEYFGPEMVFKARIRRTTAMNQANMLGKAVCDLDSRCIGCEDYMRLAREIVERVTNLET